MADSSKQQQIERIHGSGCECVVSLTGGGSQAIADLLAVPGASASLLEAVVPYSAAVLAQFLGGRFDHACSEPMSRAMAMAAFERTRKLSPADPITFRGIGATASLTTKRPKRGTHRVYVAWQSAGATVSYSSDLTKGRRTRVEEEVLAGELVLQAIAEACGVSHAVLPDPSADERVVRREQRAPVEWTDLLLGRRESVLCGAASVSRIIFPGAFHPVHAGHRRMAEIAAARGGAPVTMELSIANVDKPMLDFIEIADRVAGLRGFPVLLTRTATFVEKSALVPDATFVVGADTIARIADTKYYGGSSEKCAAAVTAIAAHGCRFLVFGRAIDDRFCALTDLKLPAALRALCSEVSVDEFRAELSSTQLRTPGD